MDRAGSVKASGFFYAGYLTAMIYKTLRFTIQSFSRYRKWVIRSRFAGLNSINGQNASMADFDCRISASNFTSSTAGN